MSRKLHTIKSYKILLILLFVVSTVRSIDLDTFGIAKFYATKAGTREWNSAHWNNGHARLVQYDGDPYDPTGWTDNHSSSSGDSLYIDGNGLLMINGSGPRFIINSTERYFPTAPAAKVPAQFFLNIEATAYFRRIKTGGSNWDGMEIQVRTDPLGHESAGGNVCEATGLASRFRDDGKWDWEKELKHPNSTVYSTKYNYDAPLFAQGTIPLNRWIGMKFIVCNINNNTRVKLETYIDSVSDVASGRPAQGGHWDLVGTMIDSNSNWPSADISGCPDLTKDMAVTRGHGGVLIRTDNEACNWKMFSIREIDIDKPLSVKTPQHTGCYFSPEITFKNSVHLLKQPLDHESTIRIFDLSGRLEYKSILSAGAKTLSVSNLGRGLHFVKTDSDKGVISCRETRN